MQYSSLSKSTVTYNNIWFRLSWHSALLCFLIALTCCGKETNPNIGKVCSTQDDCGSETGEYCHTNPAGRYVCLREVWCVNGVCRKDCTGSCSIGYGAGYLGTYDTIDCMGDSSGCSDDEKCVGLTNAYFACVPQ